MNNIFPPIIFVLLGYFMGMMFSDYIYADMTRTVWTNIWTYFWLFLWPFGLIYHIFWVFLLIVVVVAIVAFLFNGREYVSNRWQRFRYNRSRRMAERIVEADKKGR